MTSIHEKEGPLILNPRKLDEILAYDPVIDDRPTTRIQRLSNMGSKSLYHLDFHINHRIAETVYGGGRIGEVVVKSVRHNGLSSVMGVDYRNDMQDRIHKHAAYLTREVAATDLTDEEKLQRLANMTGVMIAEAQSFSSGNKRTARAMYGRILYGREGIVRGHNEDIDFEPPADIDRLVMLQNVARLRAERDGTVTPRAFGGLYVDPAIEQSIQDMVPSVDAFRFRHGNVGDTPIETTNINTYRLQVELESLIPDSRIRTRFIRLFFQEDYGPAVASLVFDGPCDIFESLDAQKVVDIIETNSQLLRMRLKSFMAAAACGGYFVSIEEADEEGRARKIVKTKWEPEVSPIDFSHPKHSTVRV